VSCTKHYDANEIRIMMTMISNLETCECNDTICKVKENAFFIFNAISYLRIYERYERSDV